MLASLCSSQPYAQSILSLTCLAHGFAEIISFERNIRGSKTLETFIAKITLIMANLIKLNHKFKRAKLMKDSSQIVQYKINILQIHRLDVAHVLITWCRLEQLQRQHWHQSMFSIIAPYGVIWLTLVSLMQAQYLRRSVTISSIIWSRKGAYRYCQL